MVYKRWCVFPGCRNSASGPSNMSFFRVHSSRFKQRDLGKWKEACAVREFHPTAVICEEHFENDDFVNPCYKTQGLKQTAVPTRNPKCRQAPSFEVVDITRTADGDRLVKAEPGETAKEQTHQNHKGENVHLKDEKVFKGRKEIVKLDMTQNSASVLKIKKILGDSKASREQKAKETVVKPLKRVTITSLKQITCRLCLMANRVVAGLSAFRSFAGENSLSKIVETCFGIRIEEHDFCTKICLECLVKVDVAWKLYSEFQSNRLALEEFYQTIRDKKKETDAEAQDEPEPVENRPVKKRKKVKSDSDPSDSDSYSLPEHPFFTKPSKKNYQCHLCPKRFKKESMLNYHLSFKHHDSDQLRLCEYCAKFFHKHKLSNHIQHHVEQKKVICPTCSKIFHNSRNLCRHMFVHTKERPYLCKLCDKSFTQSSYLKFHVQRDHPTEENRPNPTTKAASTKSHPGPLPCPACGKQFKRAKQLIAHVQSTHPGHPPDVFACGQCSERFVGVLQLRSHLLIYHSGQKFECDRCGLVFKSDGQLRTHRQKHEREGVWTE